MVPSSGYDVGSFIGFGFILGDVAGVVVQLREGKGGWLMDSWSSGVQGT